jgi:hypothetical protein
MRELTGLADTARDSSFQRQRPMSEKQKTTRRKTSGAFTWTCLVLVPAIAIVGLGMSLSLATGGPATPAGLQVAETRAFAAQGDTVTATNKPADQGSLAEFSDSWQNTVRVPPSPRR